MPRALVYTSFSHVTRRCTSRRYKRYMHYFVERDTQSYIVQSTEYCSRQVRTYVRTYVVCIYVWWAVGGRGGLAHTHASANMRPLSSLASIF